MKTKNHNDAWNLIREYSIWFVLLVMFIIAMIISPNFRTLSNISNLLSQSAIIGVLAIGQTIVLITCGFDLSQSSMLALASVIIAIFMPYGYLPALLLLLGLGVVNAFFVNVGISPFVVTLGMQGIARTLALWWSNQESVNIKGESIKFLVYTKWLGISVCVYLWVLMTIVFSLFLANTTVGRHIYAIGGNAESARLSGVNVRKTRYVAYVISAFCSFVAGCIYASKLGVGVPDKSIGYEMDAISVSIIGGTSLLGGAGSLKNTFAGVLIYSIITNAMNILGISAYWQKIIKGLIILIAVYFNMRAKRGQKNE